MNEAALKSMLNLHLGSKAPSLSLQLDNIPNSFAEQPSFWSEEWLKQHLKSMTEIVYFGVRLPIYLPILYLTESVYRVKWRTVC
jgi:hypothetical protein